MDLGSLSLPSFGVRPSPQMAFLQSDGTQAWAPRSGCQQLGVHTGVVTCFSSLALARQQTPPWPKSGSLVHLVYLIPCVGVLSKYLLSN